MLIEQVNGTFGCQGRHSLPVTLLLLFIINFYFDGRALLLVSNIFPIHPPNLTITKMDSGAPTTGSMSKEHEEDTLEEAMDGFRENEEHRRYEAASESLKEEILAAIEPYTRSDDEPNLSGSELAVMAELCLYDKKYLVEFDIVKWMMKQFPYYLDQAAIAYYSSDYCDGDDDGSFQKVFPANNQDVLNCDWDVPLEEHGDFEERKLHVNPYEGRIFLRRILEPKRDGEFRFLDLPAEIREAVYEYVFTFPRSGLGFRPFSDRSHLSRYDPKSSGTYGRLLIQRAARGDEKNESTKQWSRASRLNERGLIVREENYMRLSPMNSILALLSVNKQIHEEAMPFFYRNNHFYMPSLNALKGLLTGCGAWRRKYFTSIAFNYDIKSGNCCVLKDSAVAAVFDLPREVKNLRFLQIEARDKKIWHSEKGTPHSMESLKRVKVEKLELIGECPKLEEYLKEEMTKPKVSKDKQSGDVAQENNRGT